MKKLNDIEIAKTYKDKKINNQKLQRLFNYNGKRKHYANAPFEFDQFYCQCFYLESKDKEMFGITPILHEKWGYSGTYFDVFLDLIDGNVLECRIYKEKDSGFRSIPLSPTQQEIRIFRRIMDYITDNN